MVGIGAVRFLVRPHPEFANDWGMGFVHAETSESRDGGPVTQAQVSSDQTAGALRGQRPIEIDFLRSRSCLVAFAAVRRAAFGIGLRLQISHGEGTFLFRWLRLARFVRHGRYSAPFCSVKDQRA